MLCLAGNQADRQIGKCRMQDAKGAHRSGSEWAALAVLSYAASAWTLYSTVPNVLTGALLGLGGAWIGLTVQHCGNHGAMSNSTLVNNLMGLCDDLVGGSSLMWRYHHQVSTGLCFDICMALRASSRCSQYITGSAW